MGRKLRELFQEAAELSESERAELAGLLLESLEGVADEDVEAAEVLDGALDHLVDLFGLPHVELNGERVDPRLQLATRLGVKNQIFSGH